MTLHTNTDCLRCGADLGKVYAEPEDVLHCPACMGVLLVCGRMEDGGVDRAADIHVFAWFAPYNGTRLNADSCDCAGCESRAQEGR